MKSNTSPIAMTDLPGSIFQIPGMKRKLSVGIAFIGGSKFVLLDGEARLDRLIAYACPQCSHGRWTHAQSLRPAWTPTRDASPGTSFASIGR
jgi:hypothetical protein